MKLSTNSKCQLILDGPRPEIGLEVIVYGDKYTVIERKDESSTFFFDMPEDGLFQYFVLEFEEEPEDLLEYIQDKGIIPQKEHQIFSICKLRNCLLKMEKDYITEFLHGCNTKSHCSNESDVMRNFLLSTIFVLEHLICSGQTVDALRILKNINSCTLCSDDKPSNCGCNGGNI